MDPALEQVHQCLRATMLPDAAQRQQAEELLGQSAGQPGHVVSLFRICADPSLPTELEVRQASVIRMKNIIMKGWEPPKDSSTAVVGDADKQLVRENLVEAVVCAPHKIRSQLGLCLRAIAHSDYPQQWPTLLQKICDSLQTPDPNRVYGALYALRVLCKNFEFKNNEKRLPLEDIVERSFPLLSQILRQLLTAPPTVELSELSLLVAKIFWALPRLLYATEHMQEWMQLLITLLEQPLPDGAPTDLERAASWPPWKGKKRVAQILHRLLQRYGNPKHKTGKQEMQAQAALTLIWQEMQAEDFARCFQEQYSVPCLRTSLQVLERAIPGNQPCPDRVVTLCLNYVEEAVKFKNTYAELKPHLQRLLVEFVFPLLCFNQRDAELWEQDPVEFVRKEYDVMEDFYNPRTAAQNLLMDITKQRAKDTLHIFITYCSQVLAELQHSTDAAALRRKDGALLAVGALHSRLHKKPEYASSLEPMLQMHVFPSLDSPVSFVRLRACWTYGQFAKSLFAGGSHDQAQMAVLFNKILERMRDPDLPVRVQAALAINNFVEADCAGEAVIAVLPQLVEQLFAVMNDVGNDEARGL